MGKLQEFRQCPQQPTNTSNLQAVGRQVLQAGVAGRHQELNMLTASKVLKCLWLLL